MKGSRVLITGGSGFIGQYLIHELKERGAIVLGTSMGTKTDDLVPISLSDKEGLTRTIEEFAPDWIVHLAAIALVTHGDIQQIYGVNVLGSENLFEAVLAAQIKRPTMLLASTAGVYGNQNVEYLSEELAYNPSNHYSYSKMVMEMLAKQYSDDIKIHIVRPFNIIGSGQAESFLIPKIVRHFVDRAPELKLGNINSVRDYVDVHRCAWMVAELMSRNHQDPFTVNLCSGRGWTGYDVLDCLTEISGYRPSIEVSDKFVRKNEVWRLVGDHHRLHELLQANPKLPDLKQILESMYNSRKQDA
ncbi:GDP-mannose 4,6-dehydratase [Pseudomonas nicosulfuronedens]|uniref:NAD-dependent epimerase/dehydratase family protein n=2 Tax=Pseudomonas nicosulfuronedens TaxID=2571105 RepID=UPI00244B7DC0|nr:NAD-dependent epimerase/dehydratase family protein [Pseudomonas nicosulfuronedens]MDH1008764.1 GDP-mannose 4,6-dehydratase [Pseudomonas nicosulfuronedens]MDH1981663.1 GDP-mannose 4,6-dehydratase [Pseudomonas nicosulfuronedens]MDH2028575.1 GDP-mannose 4,6-dehydratase [Pseudomonas nicosulfuronedens]